MTKIEIVMALTAFMSITWAGIVTMYAFSVVKKYKAKVAHYRHKKTQIAIANHVIKNHFFQDEEAKQ